MDIAASKFWQTGALQSLTRAKNNKPDFSAIANNQSVPFFFAKVEEKGLKDIPLPHNTRT